MSKEDIAMSELILPATTLFRFNSDMLSLLLANLDPKDADRRWKDGKGSSIVYLTGHLMSSRCDVLKAMGASTENPYKGFYGAGAGSQDHDAYPPIGQLKDEWDELADRFHAALNGLTDKDALREGDGSFPTPDNTLRGNLTFIAWHEAYHLGQVGIMRTEMGYLSTRQTLYRAQKGE
jgi:uncharacterized damage-inducible protein DinB